ncbi:MAG: lipid II flippase MurJ, partial [Candidatus Gastranaerophilales bacterium]|nr:lipid II flippase MurJ [Candidatus Gastranaerophilales bacterium]
DTSGVILAYATLIGAIGQLLIQLPVFAKSGFNFKPQISIKDKKVAEIREILFPAIIATTIGQLNIYIDMFFASRLIEGAWSAIGYANRLFQFPTGIIITALLVPLFPIFSTFVGKKDYNSLRLYFHKGIGSLWFLAFPILGFIFLYAPMLIQIVFQRGNFTSGATLMVSEALMFLSVSIIPYVARDTITRVFYSFNDSKTPFYVATFSIFVKFLMNSLLVDRFGISGITLSTAIVTFVNFTILAFFVSKKVDLQLNKLLFPTFKIISATLIMVFAGYQAKLYLTDFWISSSIGFFIEFILYTLICATVYFIACILLKVEAINFVTERFKKKFTNQIEPEKSPLEE